MDAYVFIIGKSDPHYESVKAIRRLGYLVGIFQDSAIPIKKADEFDVIIEVDFLSLDRSIATIIPNDIHIIGLQCTYENYIIAKAKLGVVLNVPTQSVESATVSTDKLLMRQAFLKKNPVITPRFALASTLDDVRAFAATTTFPLIIKPTNLVKSLLVMRCNTEEELVDNFYYAQEHIGELYKKYNIRDRSPQLIVEEFISGKSCSIAAFVDHMGTPHFCEGVVSLATAAEHGAHDTYLYCRAIPLEIESALRATLFAVAEEGIRALGMRSVPAHVELMYTDDSVKIIEIGARIGGYRPRMYAYSYGIDLLEQEIQLTVGKLPKLGGVFANYTAVYELFPDQEASFQAIDGNLHTSEVEYFSVKPTEGQLIGPAKHGYKATAIIIVVEKDKQQFETIRQKIDLLTVSTKS